MSLKPKHFLFFIVLLGTIVACNRSPKGIVASEDKQTHETISEIFPDIKALRLFADSNQARADDLHTVIVNEILPTTKYVYLNVTEGNDQYWVATIKQPVNIGGKYYFNGGLLKNNFKSTEHNRVFKKLYMVSNLVAVDHGINHISVNEHTKQMRELKKTHTDKSVKTGPESHIKIKELVSNSKKYEGKTVIINGECVKINPNIMNRNWIHLKDGSMDDFDLVITSSSFVDVGSVVTMSGKVVLNKDFGAGYKYAIILENGKILINTGSFTGK